MNPYRELNKEEVIPFKRPMLSKLRRLYWKMALDWKGKFLERYERCSECRERLIRLNGHGAAYVVDAMINTMHHKNICTHSANYWKWRQGRS